MKPTAKIRNWRVIRTSDQVLCIIGTVYEDIFERWEDGTEIYIYYIEYFEDNYAITKSGIFLLED